MKELLFNEQGDVLTLWPEKIIGGGYVVGYSPELKNNIAVHPENIICGCQPGMKHDPACLFVTGELA